jgi:phage baseplate assembly protein W
MVDIRVSEVAIALPFRVDSFGAVTKTVSQEKIWSDRVKVAVGTAVTERVMRPDYGNEIAASVHKNTEETQQIIRQETELVFSRDLPLLSLVSVETYVDTLTAVLTADITYSLPNRTEEVVTLGFAKLTGNLPISEDAA